MILRCNHSRARRASEKIKQRPAGVHIALPARPRPLIGTPSNNSSSNAIYRYVPYCLASLDLLYSVSLQTVTTNTRPADRFDLTGIILFFERIISLPFTCVEECTIINGMNLDCGTCRDWTVGLILHYYRYTCTCICSIK